MFSTGVIIVWWRHRLHSSTWSNNFSCIWYLDVQYINRYMYLYFLFRTLLTTQVSSNQYFSYPLSQQRQFLNIIYISRFLNRIGGFYYYYNFFFSFFFSIQRQALSLRSYCKSSFAIILVNNTPGVS